MSCSGLLISYQCLIQDYPIEACIRSMLDIVDVGYVNDGMSTDGTLDLLYQLQTEYGKDRLVVIARPWVHDRGFWARERNYILDEYVKTDWVLSLDADEILHEKELPILSGAMKDSTINSVSFKVKHFYGTPYYTIQGPSWFTRHTQLWRTSTGIRWLHREGGCADDIVWPNGMYAHLYNAYMSEAYLYHYGHCRSPRAMGMKVKRADDLYQNSVEYKDGSLAVETSWKYDMDREGIIPFVDSHPKYIAQWVESHRTQDLEFFV